MISGDLVGKFLGILSVLVSGKGSLGGFRSFYRSISKNRILFILKKYKSFPYYFLPSNVLANLSAHLPLYFFQIQFGSGTVGAYALASSMLEIINRVIPYSLSPVFLQKGIELKQISHVHLAERVYKLFLVMLLLATIIFSGFALFGKILFPFAFGKNWVMAGSFSTILAIQFAFNFVSVAISEIYVVMNKQRFLLVNSILTVVLKFIAIAVIIILKLEVINALLVYSVFTSIGGTLLILGVFVILRYKVLIVGILLVFSVLTLLTAFALQNIFL
jgi:O-antigen/teichoic acid export membrane protein